MIQLKYYLSALLLFLAVNLYAGYDTLEITHRYAIYLVFDHPIEWVDLGQGDQYHYKIEGNCLFIKAAGDQVNPSTLLVKQASSYYQAWLQYTPNPLQWFYPIEQGKSANKSIPDHTADSIYYDELITRMMKKENPMKLLGRKRQNLHCQLKQLAVDSQAIYLVFQLENSSSIDFELDFISFEWIQLHSRGWFKKKKKSVKYSKVLSKKHPKIIAAVEKELLGFVIPVFAAEKSGKLKVTFREINGDRTLSMDINARHFHHAMRINSN